MHHPPDAPDPDSSVVSPLQSKPAEDSGSRTLDRYSWQSRMAARDLLVLVAADIEDGIDHDRPPALERSVVCEWLEDWIVVNDGSHELVSAKHRDLDQGAWELNTLTVDGGLAHLYRTCQRLNSGATGRIVSNQALLKGKDHGLGALCVLSDRAGGSPRTSPTTEQALDTAHHVARHLLHAGEKSGITGPLLRGRMDRAENCRPCDELKSRVHAFLTGLTLDMSNPPRSEIEIVGPHEYVRPVLKSLGHPLDTDTEVWRRLVAFVDRCMRMKGESEWDGLTESVMRLRTSTDTDDLPADLQRRRISSAQARAMIDRVAGGTRRRRPLPSAPYRTVAAVKMDEGGCTPTAIETAEEQMARWEQTISSEVDDSPGQHAQLAAFDEELGLQLQDLHHEIQSAAPHGKPYGSELWQRATRLPLDELPEPPFQMNRRLLVGAVTARTDSCRFWLGDERFDAHTVLRAANEAHVDAQQGASFDDEEDDT